MRSSRVVFSLLFSPTFIYLKNSALAAIIAAVSERRVALFADDIYKICAIMMKPTDDVLELKKDDAFMRSLAFAHRSLPKGSIPPFQAGIIDGVLKGVDLDQKDLKALKEKSSSSEDSPSGAIGFKELLAGSDTSDQLMPPQVLKSFTDATIEERIKAIWECVSLAQSGGYSTIHGRQVEEHCKALDPIIRKLSATEAVSVSRALATLNYYNFEFSTLLARRCCETAAGMTAQQLCQTYFNLIKLNVHDSLVGIVRRIDEKVSELTWRDVFLFMQGLERQPNTSAAPTSLVPKVLTRSLLVLKDVNSPSFFRASLVAIGRYNAGSHSAIPAIVKAAASFASNMRERDLVPILRAVTELKMFKTEGFVELFNRATELVPVMDLHLIDQLVDVISVCPIDTTEFMDKLMNRLTADAGKLGVPSLCFLVDLISDYPPAKGSQCAVALAFAVNLRKESLDRENAEKVILAFSRMGNFTDDFFEIAEFILTKRHQGVVRSFDSLSEFLKYLNKDVILNSGSGNSNSVINAGGPGSDGSRMLMVLSKTMEFLSPVLNDEEILHFKKQLAAFKIEDKIIQGILQNMRKSSNDRFIQKRMNRNKLHDPCDDL